MLPPLQIVRKATRASTSHRTAAVIIPISSTDGHKSTSLASTSRLWNKLPEEIVAIRERNKFKTEVNAFLGAVCQRLPPVWIGTTALHTKMHTERRKKHLIVPLKTLLTLTNTSKRLLTCFMLHAFDLEHCLCQAS